MASSQGPKDAEEETALTSSDVPGDLKEDEKPKTRVHVIDSGEYEVYGVDAIWTNQYKGPLSDWGGFRCQYDAPIDDLIKLVARHISEGKYFIISMTATKHSLHVLCGCTISSEELFKGFGDADLMHK